MHAHLTRPSTFIARLRFRIWLTGHSSAANMSILASVWPQLRSAWGCMQEASLSLAFDYAEHDLYEMIRFHRERAASAPALSAYTVKSLVWQMLQVTPRRWHASLDRGPQQTCTHVADLKIFVACEHNDHPNVTGPGLPGAGAALPARQPHHAQVGNASSCVSSPVQVSLKQGC